MAARSFILLTAIPLIAAIAACGDDDDPADSDTGTSGTGAAASGTGAVGSGAFTGAGGDTEGGAPSAGGAGTGATGGGQPMTCEDVTAAYNALVGPDHQTCEPTEMCQVLMGHCAQGLGGCHYVVNSSVTQADLEALLQQWLALGCQGGVCDCAAPPTSATCQRGMCVGVE